MKKTFLRSALIMLICLAMLLPIAAMAAAARDTAYEEDLASDLKGLGLFMGVSDTDFDLGRAPTRIEAIVMLIRVLGKAEEAASGDWTHPFTDVASWADKYVGYAYQNGLTSGISQDKFGTGRASASMYITFVLRALGYSDANGEDFTWSDPYTLAQSIGILPEGVDTDDFWRADVAAVSYAALSVKLKGTDITLAQKLIESGAFTKAQFDEFYHPEKIGAPSDVQDTPAPSYTPTANEQNAVNMAKAYLAVLPFSVPGLKDQLIYEGFTAAEAEYAVANCGADWKEQAFKKAQSYIDYTAMSKEELKDQLAYEEFTAEQIDYAVANTAADWMAEALEKAKSYIEYQTFSESGLKDQLAYNKYTAEQIDYAVANCGADWMAEAAEKAAASLKYSAYTREELIYVLENAGFTTAQAIYGAEQNGL